MTKGRRGHTGGTMKRPFRRILAFVGLFAMLFSQLVTAAYACPQLVEAPVAQSTDCDHDRVANPNLCQRHCDEGNVSLDSPKPPVSLDMAPAFDRPILAMPALETLRAVRWSRVATGPPVTRFTVLRI